MKIVPRIATSIRRVPVSSILAGVPFVRGGNESVFMRLKPTGFILNSSVICDIINRNDIIIVDLKQGTMYAIKGSEEVEMIEAELNVTF